MRLDDPVNLPAGELLDHVILPDSSAVLYTIYQPLPVGRVYLGRVGIGGGPVSVFCGELDSFDYDVSADSRYAVYACRTPGGKELRSRLLSTGEEQVLDVGVTVEDLLIDPTSRLVYYAVGGGQIFRVPIDGGTPQAMSPAFRLRNGFATSPDGESVFYRARIEDPGRFQLYRSSLLMPLFADGFESGDIGAWSSASP